MAQRNYKYKSVRITLTDGCLTQDLLDVCLNREAQDGWEFLTVFPHSCPNSNMCSVIIFRKEVQVN